MASSAVANISPAVVLDVLGAPSIHTVDHNSRRTTIDRLHHSSPSTLTSSRSLSNYLHKMYKPGLPNGYNTEQVYQAELLMGEQAVVQALRLGQALPVSDPRFDNGGLFLRQFAAKAKHAAGHEERFRRRVARAVVLPMRDPRSHFQQTHIELKHIASGSNGSAYVTLLHPDIDEAWNRYQTHRSQETLCADLRSAFVVAKFARSVAGYNGEADLENEIEFLSLELLRLSEVGRNLMTFAIEAHVDGSCKWLTLPYIAGGTLGAFFQKCWRETPVSLQWHFSLQIAKALAFIHFGATDDAMTPKQSWPLQSFNDLHSGNILLQPSKDGKYPSVVIADFGRAQRYPDLSNKYSEGQFRCSRSEDYVGLSVLIEGMVISSRIGKPGKTCRHCNCPGARWCRCPRIDCEECLRVAKCYGLLPALSRSEKLLRDHASCFRALGRCESDATVLATLRAFVLAARQEIMEDVYPLTDAMRAHLGQQLITDAELLDTMQLLASRVGQSL